MTHPAPALSPESRHAHDERHAPPNRGAPTPHTRRPFRRRDARHTWSLHFGPNMTPMVDVVMVILVFFMASAAFLGPEWYLKSLVPQKAPPAGSGPAQTAKPESSSTVELPPVRLEITLETDADAIASRGSSTTRASGVGTTRVTVDELLAALDAFAKDTDKDKIEVLIKPAKTVPYRDVVRIHEGALRAGITRVGVGVTSAVTAPANTPAPQPRDTR